MEAQAAAPPGTANHQLPDSIFVPRACFPTVHVHHQYIITMHAYVTNQTAPQKSGRLRVGAHADVIFLVNTRTSIWIFSFFVCFLICCTRNLLFQLLIKFSRGDPSYFPQKKYWNIKIYLVKHTYGTKRAKRSP